jgi:MFS family permease
MTEKRMTTMRDNAAFRWLMLLLISGLMFATYYFQDFYSGLRGLMETEFGFSAEQFGRILGLTTIANVFGMIIVGGIILDKWGIRVAGYVFGGIAALGGLISALTASGLIFQDSTLTGLILGRVFFGIGLEVVCVIVMRTIVKWFKGYEVALAMGINMGFGRLGSALAIAISLDIAGGVVSPAVTFAAALIGIAMIMFVIYTVFDYRLDAQDKKLAAMKAEIEPHTAGEAKADDSEDFKFSDLIKLVQNSSFVYITLLCVAFYSAVFPFIQYAPDILVNKFGFAYVLPEAGIVELFGSKAMGSAFVYIVVFLFALGITLIPNNLKNVSSKNLARVIILALFGVILYLNQEFIGVWLKNGPKTAALIPLGTIIFTPIFGSIVDKKGKAASLMMLGALLLIFAHLSLSLGEHPMFAYMGLLSLGVAFSLVPAAMWPSVAKIVPENRLGTAYASMFTVQNWGLGLFFWGIGALLIAIPVNKETKADIDQVRTSLVVTDDYTQEDVAVVLEDFSMEIRNKMEGTKGELAIVEAFLIEAESSLAQYGFLTSGQVGELIKQKQAIGALNYYDYKIPIFILVFCGVVSIFLAFKLKQADRRQGFGLELPSNNK